jgi:hypothetical protein
LKMLLSSNLPSKPETDEGHPLRPPDQRGLKLRHWIVIILFSAFIVDISVRFAQLLESRKSRVGRDASAVAAKRATYQLLKQESEMERRSAESTKRLDETLERLEKHIEIVRKQGD